MNLIFRYLEMISRYQEMISRYQEISRITDIGKWFPDIHDIGKSGSGVELPHLAFITDDEMATVVPPRLKSVRPKSTRPNAVPTWQYTPDFCYELINTYLDPGVSTTWNIQRYNK